MKRQSTFFFVFAVGLALAGVNAHAAKIKDVKVVNGPGEPVPVLVDGVVPVVLDEPVAVSVPEPLAVDVDAVRQPFQFDGFIIRESVDDPPQVTLFDVPADRSLVIETLSVAAFQAEVLGPTLLVERGGNALASPVLVQNGASPSYSSLHRVVLRIGAGATVDGIVNSLGRFRFMISGYLLPAGD